MVSKTDFIAKIFPFAAMDQLQSGVPASLTIAQAALGIVVGDKRVNGPNE